MEELKIGVIGFGNRGRIVGLAQKVNGVKVVAAADIYEPSLELFKETYGQDCFVTKDYRDLLAKNDIDALFITSPDHLHEEHAIAALNAGKAVYLEKPIAISIEGADRILEAAFQSGSKLYLGHNMRHFPVINKMKEIVDSGIIGKIKAVWCRHFINYGGDAYFKDWHSEQRNTCGLLLQKGAHDIDVIHYVTGETTTSVSGMGMLSVYDKCEKRSPKEHGDPNWNNANWPPEKQTGLSPIIDVEDHNMLMMQLTNGIQASYTQCHFSPDAERNYTFIGTQGRLENIGDSDTCEVHVWNSRGSRATPDIVYHLKPVEGSHGGSDPDIVKTFIDFIRDNKKPKTNPVAARNAVAVGVLGHKSMRENGERFQVPPCSDKLTEYFEKGQVK